MWFMFFFICFYLRILESNRSSILYGFVSFNSSTTGCHEWSRNCLPFRITCPVFRGICVARSLVFYEMICRSLFVFWLMSALLRSTASDYPFGISSSYITLLVWNSLVIRYGVYMSMFRLSQSQYGLFFIHY
jgi:hypothetical protein